MSNVNVLPASEFLKKNLGISEIPVEAYLNYGYALLTIAGADGEVSEAELNWLLNHQRMAGAPPEAIEKYKTFEYKKADLENLLTKITVDVPTWSKSRSLLYHAIQMARADQNYSVEEQKAVKKVLLKFGTLTVRYSKVLKVTQQEYLESHLVKIVRHLPLQVKIRQ